MQKFEALIKPTHGHTQNSSALAAATSASKVTPALSDLTSAGFTRLGIISETTLENDPWSNNAKKRNTKEPQETFNSKSS